MLNAHSWDESSKNQTSILISGGENHIFFPNVDDKMTDGRIDEKTPRNNKLLKISNLIFLHISPSVFSYI